MTDSGIEREQRVLQAYDRVLDVPGAERIEFIRKQFAADPTLARELERLVEAGDRAESGLLAEPADALAHPMLADLHDQGGVVDVDLHAKLRSALAPRYRIEEPIGSGGMATVYVAFDSRLARSVAVKVLRPEVADRLTLERFEREVATAARLDHPRIVQVYDRDPAPGVLYYVMRYVGGGSLRDRLAKRPQLEIPETISIARHVAEALDYAHAQHVVHRDIKPENVLLDANGAYLADFGVARLLDAAGREHLTHTGMAIGTVLYMSPEQAESSSELDGRSDVYSLTCVIYEMLAGQPPYAGKTQRDILIKHMVAPIPDLCAVRPEVTRQMQQVIAGGLQKSPADRLATARELVDGLERAYLESGRDTTVAGTPTVRPRTIAVLPFKNMSGDPANEYFSDGITEELIGALTRSGGMGVVARTSCFVFKDLPRDIREIGVALGATHVLEGSVRMVGRRLRASAHLVDAASGNPLWSERYDRDVEDVFAVQDDITNAIVIRLRRDLELPIASKESGLGAERVAPDAGQEPPPGEVARAALEIRARHERAADTPRERRGTARPTVDRPSGTPRGSGTPLAALAREALAPEEGSLEHYLRDISAYPLISRDEEVVLVERIRANDQEALEKLVRSNLRFVVSVAKKYQNQGVSLSDLITEGNLGLIRAAHKFDETKGIRFIAYAVWWIRQAILQALAEQSRIIRVPRDRAGTLHRIGKGANTLLEELGREPTHEEIAEGMDITEKALTESIEEALSHLKEREAKILRLYFGLDGTEPMTLEAIGSLLGITPERVRQIKKKALSRLRHVSRARALESISETQLDIPIPAVERFAAYDAYLRGRFLQHFESRAESLEAAIEQFDKAIEGNPEFAPAYAARAYARTMLARAGVFDSAGLHDAAMQDAEAALKLAPTLAEAHVANALVAMFFEWDRETALAALDRAVELSPAYADAHLWRGFALTWLEGKPDEAIKSLERALDFDPLSLVALVELAFAYWMKGDFEEAHRQAQKAVESGKLLGAKPWGPDKSRERPLADGFASAHHVRAVVVAELGRLDEAIADATEACRVGGRQTMHRAHLGMLYGLRGDSTEARAVIAELETRAGTRHRGVVAATAVATVYCGLRDSEHVLEYLNAAYEGRDVNLIFVPFSRHFAKLRSDPRFAELLDRLRAG